jgi:CDP-glucose 4,6-dehydratase
MDSVEGDVRDHEATRGAVAAAAPEVVIHMAAQSLVRRSFAEPRETYETNVMGTVNVLDAVRRSGDGVRVRRQRHLGQVLREPRVGVGLPRDEPMGGHDPYSSSKGCAELVTARFAARSSPIPTARASPRRARAT